MKITIEIDTDNAAWEQFERELKSVLERARRKISDIETYADNQFGPAYILDTNGNTTGKITITKA